MNRPYIICHMTTSIDGKVTGDFLSSPECERAVEIYYEINRDLKPDGVICGRVTMEESFTKGWYPDLEKYMPVTHGNGLKMDYMLDEMSGFYAVAFDPKGKLGWQSNTIVDDDPGYGGAQIIEVLTEQVDERYLGYLEEMSIPYIFAGEKEIDVELALFKLKNIVGAQMLLLEGGSIINGSFLRANVIDELSLVVAPVIADKNDKPLFDNATPSNFILTFATQNGSVMVLNYAKTGRADCNNHVKIKWLNALTIDEAIASEASNTKGLYYITRVFGKKETTLYLGIATKNNTIRHRLEGHLGWWLGEKRGIIKVRIGKIIYPYTDIDEVIDHAESAILYEHGKLFKENVSKIKSYTYNNLYRIENYGDVFELKPIIDMSEQE